MEPPIKFIKQIDNIKDITQEKLYLIRTKHIWWQIVRFTIDSGYTYAEYNDGGIIDAEFCTEIWEIEITR